MHDLDMGQPQPAAPKRRARVAARRNAPSAPSGAYAQGWGQPGAQPAYPGTMPGMHRGTVRHFCARPVDFMSFDRDIPGMTDNLSMSVQCMPDTSDTCQAGHTCHACTICMSGILTDHAFEHKGYCPP